MESYYMTDSCNMMNEQRTELFNTDRFSHFVFTSGNKQVKILQTVNKM